MFDPEKFSKIFEHGDFEKEPIVRDLPELNESEIDLGGGEDGPFMKQWRADGLTNVNNSN